MRESKNKYFARLARLTSTQATCSRRKVGCVLVNERNHVLATGYNGVAAGMAHCIDQSCAGANSPSGTNLDACEAIHAEQNALLQCKDVYDIKVAYVTTAPCIQCVKLLLNTSCQKIMFIDDYPHSEMSRTMWERAGRIWDQVILDETIPIENL